VKSFLSQLVGYLDIDSGNTRVGLVTYSKQSGIVLYASYSYSPQSGIFGTTINLNAHSSVASVQSAISSLISLYYSNTYTFRSDHVLAYVRTTMLTSAAGDRSNVPNVVVVLTDGRSNNATATQVSINDVGHLPTVKQYTNVMMQQMVSIH